MDRINSFRQTVFILRAVFTAMVLLIMTPQITSAQTYTASADFSSSQGPWDYQYISPPTDMIWTPSNPDAGGQDSWKGNEQYLFITAGQMQPGIILGQESAGQVAVATQAG